METDRRKRWAQKPGNRVKVAAIKRRYRKANRDKIREYGRRPKEKS